MKRIIILSLIITAAMGTLRAQTQFNLGGGYFGHTLSHPGIVLDLELEHRYAEAASLPLYASLGAYVHPRNHYGTFLEVGTGYRQYLRSGLFFEERIGVGVLQTFVHTDAVYRVDESGQVSEGSRVNQPDFMPSVSLGLGYDLSHDKEGMNLIWIRPKLYFQMPYKTGANYHLALQVGFTRTLGKS